MTKAERSVQLSVLCDGRRLVDDRKDDRRCKTTTILVTLVAHGNLTGRMIRGFHDTVRELESCGSGEAGTEAEFGMAGDSSA